MFLDADKSCFVPQQSWHQPSFVQITQKGHNFKCKAAWFIYKEEHLSQCSILCNLIFDHLKKEIKCHVTDKDVPDLMSLIIVFSDVTGNNAQINHKTASQL